MKRTPSHNQALALLSAIIVLACVLIIGAIAVKILLKLARSINPPAPPPGTNAVARVTGFAGITAPGVYEAPRFVFPPLEAPVGQTVENPFGTAHLEILRSTNLIDWEVIAILTNAVEADIMDYDTNPPPARAFYRGKFSYPDKDR